MNGPEFWAGFGFGMQAGIFLTLVVAFCLVERWRKR